MMAEAAATPQREVCGLLFGEPGAIEEARPAANVADDPAESFEVDPYALLAAHRSGREGGARLIGHYHSHPNGSIAPSARDAAAAEPGWLWLIVAGGAAALWRSEAAGPVEGVFHRVDLDVLP
jgi:proteasome lid subunit RPN8/RPN11